MASIAINCTLWSKLSMGAMHKVSAIKFLSTIIPSPAPLLLSSWSNHYPHLEFLSRAFSPPVIKFSSIPERSPPYFLCQPSGLTCRASRRERCFEPLYVHMLVEMAVKCSPALDIERKLKERWGGQRCEVAVGCWRKDSDTIDKSGKTIAIKTRTDNGRCGR